MFPIHVSIIALFMIYLILDRCNQVNNIQSVQNKNDNPLANLLCQYNSDSDTEDPKKDVQKLDDQVNDFFKVNESF